MANQTQNDPTKHFAPRLVPWLLGLVMLVVYGFTLNRWVTVANILPVSKASGFVWQPEIFGPLQFLALLPFRWLPPAQIPLALNLFSAVLAAVTLGLLARCVAILPHDRTEMERTRERSDFGFLTTGSAWLPPLLAVVMLGLQFGFWMNATSFTGEMLDLLVFAVIIWQLLEYRLDERPGRLTAAAVIYGAAFTNNWAMIGFLPVFIAALIWLRGLDFFDLGFLGRMAFAGLAGMSLFLFLPVVGLLTGDASLGFWGLLKPVLRADWMVIKAVKFGEVRYRLLLMSVTTLLPVLLMAIRWSSGFGDSSRIGSGLANYMFHLIHAVIFTVCTWVMLDPPFSPSQVALGSPALTFYFLSALAIGYYCGYYLLVFGARAMPSRRNPNPLDALPGPLNFFSPVVYWCTYVAAAVIIAVLAYKNLPQIRSINDATLLNYARYTAQTLPPGGAILLSDAENTSSQQTRTLLMQAALVRSGRAKDYLVVDTQSLNAGPYHRYLHKKNPQRWPLPASAVKGQDVVSPLEILSLLDRLSKSNTICYLNPSYGYFFEMFYQEAHGLVYEMKMLPEADLLPPPLSAKVIDENQNFWAPVLKNEIPRLALAINPPPPADHLNAPDWVLMRLHSQADPNPNAMLVASLYSRSLDYWGVQLQRAGQLTAAADCFAGALKMNPDNIAATVNLEFNRALQAGEAANFNLGEISQDQFGKYRNWNAVLNATGPFDEPSFLYANASLLGQSGCFRQAIASFARIRQLAPDNLPARLMLGQHYLLNRLPDPALEALSDPLAQPHRFGLTPTNSTGVSILAASAYLQKNDAAHGVELIELELSRHPADSDLMFAAAKTYFMRGLYTNALHVIDRQLARTPDDPQWLFGRGYASLQLTNYEQAIAAFTHCLKVATNDPIARFNRALAYMQSDRLNDARADYAALQTEHTNSFQVAYGLAEIAWRQRETNEAIRNYKIYLANAPTNSAELSIVRERLGQLQKK